MKFTTRFGPVSSSVILGKLFLFPKTLLSSPMNKTNKMSYNISVRIKLDECEHTGQGSQPSMKISYCDYYS